MIMPVYLLPVYATSFFGLMIRQISGEHFLPVFSGLWYLNADYIGSDACDVAFYTYTALASSPAESFKIALPPEWECDFNNVENLYNSTYYVAYKGFLTANDADWKLIASSPGAVSPGAYSVQCVSTPIYAAEVYPFYDCPPNTRLSYDNITLEIGCTNTPTSCLADIVGRDLKLDGLGWAGHVGLISTYGVSNPYVLEVLNDTDNNISGIFLNPLYGENSFTTQTEYWGSRYAPQNLGRLESDVAFNIVWIGYIQSFYKFTYTIFWDYYPGGTSEHPHDCEFRCDSFVYYCYDAGAQIKIQPYFSYPIATPWTIFHDFMCSSDPAEYCSVYSQKNIRISNRDNLLIKTPKKPLSISNITKKESMATIFKEIYFVFLKQDFQEEKFIDLTKKYYQTSSKTLKELFVRCLCFELNLISHMNISDNVRPLLSEIFWQHRYLSKDNFLLSIRLNNLSYFMNLPYCNWLNAFFLSKTNSTEEKIDAMVEYIDQQQSALSKAHLITASRLQLTQEKRLEYGKLFLFTFYNDKTLSTDQRSLLRLALSFIKVPLINTQTKLQFFNSNSINKRIISNFSLTF